MHGNVKIITLTLHVDVHVHVCKYLAFYMCVCVCVCVQAYTHEYTKHCASFIQPILYDNRFKTTDVQCTCAFILALKQAIAMENHFIVLAKR